MENIYLVEIFFDGACKNQVDTNCPMGLGIAVFFDSRYQEDLSRAILVENNEDDGTSNLSEWLALCNALQIAADLRKTYSGKIKIYGDSKIIVNQFNMIWRMNDTKFRKYFNIARSHNATAKVGEAIWIPREKNTKADELSKMGLKQCKDNSKRYQIKARHDESDSEWIEFESNSLTKVEQKMHKIYDNDLLGEATYQMWDQKNREEISFTTK